MRFAVNPLQLYAGPNGLLDFAAGPPPAEALAAARAAGFAAAQVDRFAVGSAEAALSLAAAAGIAPAPPYFSASLADRGRHAASEAAFRPVLGYARELGLRHVVVADDMTRERFLTAGRHAAEPVDPAVSDAVAAIVSRLSRLARDAGLVACFHPHVGTHVESPAEIAALLERADSTDLALCPDTGHLAWGGEGDVRGFLVRHRDRIGMLHLKDIAFAVAARGRSEGWSYGRQVTEGLWREPGRGDLDLAGVLDDFAEDADLWCVVEVDAPHEMGAAESLAASRAFLQPWSP